MTDKPRIRVQGWFRFYRGFPVWVCKSRTGYPGIGSTPIKAWNDWVYINGIDKALQPAASAQSPD